MWTSFFDKILLVNLPHRTDRLLESMDQFEEYEIPFERWKATHDPVEGARGLRDTMMEIFQTAIENRLENLLIFEDDVKFVQERLWFHDTMEKVVKQLPPNYWLCYLGGQATNGFSSFYSPNLLPVTKYFATHSVIYSLQGMKEIITRGMDFPIDNWIVDSIQTEGNCYAVNPLLCSQRPGMSDIGGQFTDWRPFIEMRHEQKINELHAGR